MSPGEPPGDGEKMEQLRELLIGPERRNLADLRRIVTEPGEKTHELSRILPHAVRLSTAKDTQLSQALAPTLESALKESVKKDPRILTDVVFPIIGPAIRKAMAEAFNKMLQSLNQTLEHSLSVQGFKWRFEAWRTGKSFAEVVLSRSLIYRVEQVFLIHKETGLLLAHAQSANAVAQDADMVSGMLTANLDFVRDFMRDAFKAQDSSSLSTQYGDYNLWLESNSQLTLVAFITGTAPEELREVLQGALERITIDQHAVLTEFAGNAERFAEYAGDASRFEAARPVLEDCLRVQLAERSGKMSPLIRALPLLIRALPLLLVLALAGLWEWSYIRQVERRAADERALVDAQQRLHAVHRAARAEQQEAARLARYAQRLNAEEGVVVTEAARRDGRNFIAGLRDPLAADPQSFLADAGLAQDTLAGRWQPYYSLTPIMVLKRAIQRLKPPAGAKLEMRGETLVVTGSASGAWVESARKNAESIPGVAGIDTSGVLDVGMLALAAKKKEIDETVIFFGEGLEIAPNQDDALKQLASRITEFQVIAKALGRRLRITVTGHTTESGGDELNLKLSRNRADRIVSTLALNGVDATTLVPVGFAAREKQFGGNAVDEAKNRRVTFSASYDESIPTP